MGQKTNKWLLHLVYEIYIQMKQLIWDRKKNK